MTRLERIARDLASVLSPRGEDDWRRYVSMAEAVGTRLCRQFDAFMAPTGAAGTRTAPHERAGADQIEAFAEPALRLER